MTVKSEIEFAKVLIEKLKQNISKGEWKYEVITDNFDSMFGGCKKGKAELISSTKDIENSTFVEFEVEGYFEENVGFYDSCKLIYVKNNDVLQTFDYQGIDRNIFEDHESFELCCLIHEAIYELKETYLKYVLSTFDLP